VVPRDEAPCAQPNIVAAQSRFRDARLATDDVAANGCGADGGRDLYFRVVLAAPQVYYFDTFGSSYDTVIRVYGKSCAAVGAGAGATACIDDSCGSRQSQVAVALPAGESCIIVDERDRAQTSGALTLNVGKRWVDPT